METISKYYTNKKLKVVDFKEVFNNRAEIQNIRWDRVFIKGKLTYYGYLRFREIFNVSHKQLVLKGGFYQKVISSVYKWYKEVRSGIIRSNHYRKTAGTQTKINEHMQKNLVQKLTNLQIEKIRKDYPNATFLWLPSDAKVPRKEHMVYYYKEFTFKNGAGPEGVIPQQEYGCKCIMKIINLV